MMGSRDGKVDGGWGKWMKFDQHPYPSSNPFEGLFCNRRASHGDLRGWSQEHNFEDRIWAS